MTLHLSYKVELLGSRIGQDRIGLSRKSSDSAIIAVADGAGNSSGGSIVAEAICGFLSFDRPHLVLDLSTESNTPWSTRLISLDRELAKKSNGGESTAVICDVQHGLITGASVGDSIAWLILSDETLVDITEHQPKKPLIGRGMSRPLDFQPTPMKGRLLIATDGLWKYLPRKRICALCLQGSLEEAASAVVDAAKAQSNNHLQDDLAIVLGEIE